MEKFFKQFFYLLFALPMGIFYFVIIITGLSLGAGLFVIWLGIPILIATFGFSTFFSNYERALANNFLGANIALPRPVKNPRGIWPNFKVRFADGRTWTRMFYLVTKLPFGIFTFTIEFSLSVTSLFLILTPLLYRQSWYRYIGIGFWHIASLPESLVATATGIVLAGLFYYATRGLAAVSVELARSALAS